MKNLKKGIYLIFVQICFLIINCHGNYTRPNASIADPYPTTFEETYPGIDKLDFLVFGDWGYQGSDSRQSVVASAMKTWADNNNTTFILSLGGILSDHSKSNNFYTSNSTDHEGVDSIYDPKWKTSWLDVYGGKLKDLVWYTVAGNHDWYTNVTAEVDYFWEIDQRFFLPSLYYVRTVTFGSKKIKASFIHIDTDPLYYPYDSLTNVDNLKATLLALGLNTPDAIESKIKWIEQQLKNVQDSKWIFVVGHHPLISGNCSSIYYMSRLPPLFEKYNVAAYLAGHVHKLEYQEVNSTSHVAYFTTGAGSKTQFEGCDGPSWFMPGGGPEGTRGFLHVWIQEDGEKLGFEFINSTTADKQPVSVYQGSLNPRALSQNVSNSYKVFPSGTLLMIIFVIVFLS
ncbi:7304_t:CDS:2 [Cetraspora pellucida]|uniref:7304_t:CDS:1 n=1 Tax=Cetraspora pellucida TaxID=1433469 RepID=A0A9N8Z2C8_9GLOM|nr:7304_t:CDS:2 [Cetraspora pellucida]